MVQFYEEHECTLVVARIAASYAIVHPKARLKIPKRAFLYL
ncbi:hypothetical protein CpCAPGE03_2205 [Corynebacterium pseudotuberculosis]|nr:hypothetical protein CPTA_00493 [Corynebacterium pseudotuberculosis]AIG10994.1 hypothetical protein CPTC_00706 [Corynebacterium pseudotuberculosis]ARS61634.1 Hypothetical protein CpATCC19410_2235 [Corynebacterium pseudotuberculosis]ATQ66423.1 Hypothetical protein CpPA07_2144 [Corynebacterium pseudotuberculosis]AUZ43988.1 Hypothetical protein CpOVI03_02111 [Corynebacterium pseudotuberculosis]